MYFSNSGCGSFGCLAYPLPCYRYRKFITVMPLDINISIMKVHKPWWQFYTGGGCRAKADSTLLQHCREQVGVISKWIFIKRIKRPFEQSPFSDQLLQMQLVGLGRTTRNTTAGDQYIYFWLFLYPSSSKNVKRGFSGWSEVASPVFYNQARVRTSGMAR